MLRGSWDDKAEPKQRSDPPPNAWVRDFSQVPGHESAEINSFTVTHFLTKSIFIVMICANALFTSAAGGCF